MATVDVKGLKDKTVWVAITITILSFLKSSFKIQKRDFLTLSAPLHTFSQALL